MTWSDHDGGPCHMELNLPLIGVEVVARFDRAFQFHALILQLVSSSLLDGELNFEHSTLIRILLKTIDS